LQALFSIRYIFTYQQQPNTLNIEFMTDSNSNNYFQFKEPWYKTEGNARHFEEELLKEISLEHSLYGRKIAAIAFRKDQDEVLFKIEGTENQYAVVHLTYKKESDPRWPDVSFYKDWETLYEECLLK
jgi:hypothetical protein